MTSASNTPPITGLLHRFERAVDAIGVRAVVARERVWWSLRTAREHGTVRGAVGRGR
ncbi:hypothetical protein AB4Z39_01705 [Mycobacterium adipatum]|uniref:hypothetical protein n=1 Tax=Mycobacterium adipatum TaxID=1682113 RepID=UPI0034E07D2C